MIARITAFFRREVVLCVSALAALLSMLLTPPCAAYWGYIDYDVLMLLFSLMAVVAGLRRSGLWDRVSAWLLRRAKNPRALAVLLIFLCFFAAMLVTNDVALITFVPLCLAVLGPAGPDCVISTMVFMTIAANLGSMATPIGNPQNLFLYSTYSVPFSAFEAAILPPAGFSAVLILLGALTVRAQDAICPEQRPVSVQMGPLALHLALFVLCLLSVLDVLPVWCAFAAVAACCAVFDWDALRQVDYSLLLTFVFFFVLAGNLAGSDAVRAFISTRMQGRQVLFGAGISQIISNVPAAVLLSSFTENWRGLLLGVNIGGLGTPVASLASLISYRLYARTPGARPGRYMLVFLGWNVLFLALLLGIAHFAL